jgi:hypothetical protein
MQTIMNLSQPMNVLIDAGLKGIALLLFAIIATFLLRHILVRASGLLPRKCD